LHKKYTNLLEFDPPERPLIILVHIKPLVEGIEVSSIKLPGPLQRKDNCKNGVGSFKSYFLRTMKPEKLNFT
jgi:hypothetical protein